MRSDGEVGKDTKLIMTLGGDIKWGKSLYIDV